jgi:signal peptidase I
MTDASLSDAHAAHLAATERLRTVIGRWAHVVLVAALLALGLRSFVYQPINIPSESMLPALLVGDYVFVAKWPYGIGRYSLPLGLPLFEGRIGATLPARGDIIVFKTPRDNRTDYIKRVIGLPGDTVAMVDGRIILNGAAIAQLRQPDFTFNARGVGCDSGPGRPDFHARDAAGNSICRYPSFAETLPGGRRIAVIDQIAGDVRDDMAAQRVPADHVFVMGDNRDDSADSRFTLAEGGVGMVPVANIVGRADRIFFSAEPGPWTANPRDWIAAIRRDRIGQQL